jgi:hypothetical protein
MSDLKTLTKEIQTIVGVTADGIYGNNTARAILENLDEDAPAKPDAGFPEVFKATPNVSYSTIEPEGVILHH